MVTFFTGTVTGPITSLTMTSVPITLGSSYTFTFMIPTTTAANYINPTTPAGQITINGVATNLYGYNKISTATAPAAYISQQITLMNTTGTNAFIATTSAYVA
jgi:hypothetical protein